MKENFRRMAERDRAEVLSMMRVFYRSDAVLSNGSEQIFNSDIDACVSGGPYAEGYVFVCDGETAGYGMLAKSFSTEFGRQCVWIEDIYVLPDFRRRGIASGFLEYVGAQYPEAVLRLEAEDGNATAIRAYEKSGFEKLLYTELIRHACNEKSQGII